MTTLTRTARENFWSLLKHSALGYLPPAEFERNHKEAAKRCIA